VKGFESERLNDKELRQSAAVRVTIKGKSLLQFLF
jgi:hypothetical protein